uniref:Zinc finger, CCHC-type, retrotransposon Gag domain protein n=1 Tax=Tanacetum cinerariifolium TaxID=118510 RepID=A0A699HY43_TANCI|nr:zinc finger, CCHC-type, retrotransposon Gag domain protein [Tanacetum cinerariifolium]
MNDFRNKMATYCDFTACDVPKFDGTLNLISSTRWVVVVEGAFRTSSYKEKNKVNFASNFLRDSAMLWWDGKICEKGKEWIGWNKKLKVERFQIMLRDDIREVISPFKHTTLDDLLSRARVREADLLRKKSKEAKETKRKLEFRDRDVRSLSKIITVGVVKLKLRLLEFSKNLFAPPNKLSFPLEVEITNSKFVVVSNVYRDVEIEIDDSIFKIDLIPIMLGVFDIVIGIDWLDKYDADFLCSQKLVWVVNP